MDTSTAPLTTSDETQDQSSSSDPRHQRRAELMQQLFAWSFDARTTDESVTELAEILPELPAIDAQLQEVAPERPLSEINKVDLAILRLIVFESKHRKTPVKVLIDEAVELAKEYGAENSAKFVNGVLGKLLAPVTEKK